MHYVSSLWIKQIRRQAINHTRERVHVCRLWWLQRAACRKVNSQHQPHVAGIWDIRKNKQQTKRPARNNIFARVRAHSHKLAPLGRRTSWIHGLATGMGCTFLSAYKSAKLIAHNAFSKWKWCVCVCKFEHTNPLSLSLSHSSLSSRFGVHMLYINDESLALCVAAVAYCSNSVRTI